MTNIRFGDYQVQREIGQGDMAVNYQAVHLESGREVVLKVITLENHWTPARKADFEQLSRAIIKMDHPHILPVQAWELNHEPPYAIMSFVPGETLDQRLKREPLLTLTEIFPIVRQVASALDYAHAHGVLHRGVKPENILLAHDDRVLLMDFAMPQLKEARLNTEPHITSGTVGYMPPEQVTQQPFDHRLDIYGLGVTLFKMAAGQMPYSGENPIAIFQQHIHAPIPSAQAHNAALPDGFDNVISRAMAKHPEHRYACAADLADELEHLLDLKHTS